MSKSGAHLSYGETRLGLGREAAREFLGQNLDIANQLEAEIREAAVEDGLLAMSAVRGGQG